MGTNLLSRIFGTGSVYETLGQGDYADEESATGYMFGSPSLRNPSESHTTRLPYDNYYAGYDKGQATAHPETRPLSAEERFRDDDGGVPESLLYEDTATQSTRLELDATTSHTLFDSTLPLPRPDTQEQYEEYPESTMNQGRTQEARSLVMNPRDRALWKWANVNNLDLFLSEVYNYFLGNGIYSILLSRFLHLFTLAFVTGFTTYLSACIDYAKVPTSSKLSEIQVPTCMATLAPGWTFILWAFGVFWIVKLIQYLGDIRLLWDMHLFYTHLLGVNETDMQTISWHEIVNRLMLLRDHNPSTSSSVKRRDASTQSRERMDAHDIANRIMRKDNYFVALFNKELLDLTVPLPFLKNKPILTGTLEWNLSFCILGYVFSPQGSLRPAFVQDNALLRQQLADGLRRRFRFASIINAVMAPFLILYLLLLYFFRYFNEYHKNPSAIGSRQYTPYAQWKFREFNEVAHIFQKRLNLSHEPAARYVAQFPNDKTMQVSRFVSFIAGSFAAVLVLASVIDPDLFLGFEITHDRTVLFYLGIFGTLVAVSRSMVPDETFVFDPEATLTEVISYTHYSPARWTDNLHAYSTKQEFCSLFDLKISIFFTEILSVVVTPLILWFSLPQCSEDIIDFFKDFTVHVDGIGYVCSFAVFDFSKHGNAQYGAPKRSNFEQDKSMPTKSNLGRDELHAKEERLISVDGKMEKSFLNFKASNPDWIPDTSGSAFLANIASRSSGNAPISRGNPSPKSPNKRRPFGGLGDSTYAATSLRARRGLDSSSVMSNTIYHPNSRYDRAFPALQEESLQALHDVPPSSFLGESFMDTTQAHRKSANSSSHVDEQNNAIASNGVFGLMQQFYQEAGSKGVNM